MRARLISILLAFCVLFAPLANGAGLALPAPTGQPAHHQMAGHDSGCHHAHDAHGAQSGHCSDHGATATEHGTPSAGDVSPDLHGCCLGFAAAALPARFSWLGTCSGQEPPIFFGALAPSQDPQGIYKPPRQNA